MPLRKGDSLKKALGSSLAVLKLYGSTTSTVYSGLFWRYSSRVSASSPCKESPGTAAENAFRPVCSLMSAALKWSRTMEEPTTASSISRLFFSSSIISATKVSV